MNFNLKLPVHLVSPFIIFLSVAMAPSSLYSASNAITETLPLEIQVDLLIEELSKERANDNHQGVIEVIARIRSLDAPFPDFLYWVEAQALHATGQILATRDRLLVYLGNAGRDGRFYRQASEMLVIISPEAERLENIIETERKQKAKEIALAEEKALFLRTQNTQRFLDQLGFRVLVNGKLDMQTREATAVYQIRRGLTVDGEITDEVIDRLSSEVPDKHVCDALAHYPLSPDDWKNIKLDAIDVTQALLECNNALRSYPDVIRFQIQYARALVAAGRADEAVLLITDVARKGYPAAEFLIGQMHLRGTLNETGKPDYKNALRLFNLSADNGYVVAQQKLGLMYEKGPGVSRDSKIAFSWYSKAAVQGYAPAQIEVGRMLVSGRGVKRNYEEALEWYRKAAASEYAEGLYRLGEMYERSRGMKRDRKQNKKTALEWYLKASEQGHAAAIEKTKRMKRK